MPAAMRSENSTARTSTEHRRQQEEAFEEHRQAVLHEHPAERRRRTEAQLQWLVKLFRNSNPSAAAAA